MAVIDIVKRQAGLLKTLTYEGTSTAAVALANGRYGIPLNHSPTYEVTALTKNGTALTLDTTYFWKLGKRFIEVTVAPAESDIYVITALVLLDTTATTDYVNDAKRIVLGKLVPFYAASVDLTTHPIVETAQAMYATGRIKEDTSEGVALESARYRSGHDLKEAALRLCDSIMRGELAILDSSDDEVARKAGTVVGGFRHADGDIADRQDWRKRLAKWDRFALSYYPFGDDITDSR